MFARFRESPTRLQVSLVETSRANGRVRHSHVAGLGAIAVPPAPADRIAFWTKLHQRLAALANRVDSETHTAILGAVHTRIPMPTQDDQRAVMIENARADALLCHTLSAGHAAEVEGQKALLASVATALAKSEATAAKSAAAALSAADRLARVERGEDVGHIPKPMTRKAMLAAMGWTEGDARHASRQIDIEEIGVTDELMADIMRRKRQVEKAAVRAMLRKRRRATHPPIRT